MNNVKSILIHALLLLPLAFLLLAGTGCNYQKDVTEYSRATPFVTETGAELVETLDFKTSLNQEREFAEITMAVDSTYEFNPETTHLSFTQPNESRGGGFYLHAKGYRTAVNVEAINALTDRDTAISDDASSTIIDAVEAATNPIP